MNQQKGSIKIILAAIIVVLVGVVGYFTFVKKSPSIQPQQNLNNIFDLNKKVSGTKIYYSDKLGVGFTYVDPSPASIMKVTESGSKIYIYDAKETPSQWYSVEVITKDPKLTLEEAVNSKFLAGYTSQDCSAKKYDISARGLSNYVAVIISPPTAPSPLSLPPTITHTSSSNISCSRYYSTSQQFLMNKDVPDKFLYINNGQDVIAYDGTPGTTKGSGQNGFVWSYSIRILK